MYRWAMLRVVIAESFQFDGRDYETRVTFDFSTRTYTARAYLAGQPANPFSHSLHDDTNCDFRQLHERTLVEGIMKEARRDVVERIWEGSILKARRELEVPGLVRFDDESAPVSALVRVCCRIPATRREQRLWSLPLRSERHCSPCQP